jgi:hypothetical protein
MDEKPSADHAVSGIHCRVQRPGHGFASTMANTELMAVQTSYCERISRRTSNNEL